MTEASHWRDNPLTSFDLETTGVNVAEDRVVTATVLRVAAGITPEFRNWLINPGVEIPAGASDVHGITTEKARAEGVDPVPALEQIRDSLLTAWDQGEPVVVFNASYDFTLLDCELDRHGLVRLRRPLGPVIDPLVIDKWHDPFRKGSRKLIDMCAYYNITLTKEEAHTSAGDTLAAVRLAYKVAGPNAGGRVRTGWGNSASFEDRRGVVHRMSLEELQAAQAKWSEEQRRSFAEYKAKRGDHQAAKDILGEVGWPIREVMAAKSEPPPF